MNASTETAQPAERRNNPFVGPRPYIVGEHLFGRKHETLELLDLLTAERIVLLYSPSGAGKTSLVQAALVPALRSRSFTVPSVARMTFETGKQTTELPANRYVYSLLLSLEEGQPSPREMPVETLAHMSIADYVTSRWPAGFEGGGLVLIIDQFEEILTVDPTDTKEKRDFFAQLGAVLQNPRLWALLSMREEHIAGLDPYRALVPTHLNSGFRLELLNETQAQEAIRGIAKLEGVEFSAGAAQKLADDLRRVRVQQPGVQPEERLGPTIEPTVLQVVCLRLWSGLPSGKETIDESDVQAHGSADSALADYYAETMKSLGARERQVREWIGESLMTRQGLRNQVLKEDALQGGRVDGPTVALLQKSHLIRAEQRRGVTWLELAHDRLVTPIRNNNAAWIEATLRPFQQQAILWERQHQDRGLEITGSQLQEATEWAALHKLTDTEQAFLAASSASHRELIQREQERTLREQERSKQRRRIVASFIGLSSFALLFGTSEYLRWLREEPWAYVSDLVKGGDLYALRGPAAIIGRKKLPIQNSIMIPDEVVSRLQMLVFENGQSLDLRSLNGTVLNGRFMRYAVDYVLHDEDIFAIAGVSAFQAYMTGPSYIPFVSKRPKPALALGTWGLLIDGRARTVTAVREPPFFLDSTPDGLVQQLGRQTDSTVVEVEQDSDRGFTLLNRSEQLSLFAMFKFEDRTYLSLQVPSGRTVGDKLDEMRQRLNEPRVVSGSEYFPKMSFCLGPPESQELWGVEGLAKIVSDDEPACTVGPFQIVVPPRQ
jgi:hypothetical protein